MSYNLICSENVAAMKLMADNSVDACITDPPYGMDIAGVGWDHNVPPVDTWREDVAAVLASAHEGTAARRLQNVLKQLLKR